jgi:dTDP-4-amino-4,6-dideoxygalactose transaminase
LETGLLAAFGAPAEQCVACGSATAGLSAALIASGRTGGVLLPAFTFPASLGAARAAGMSPIVVDVDPDSWALEGERLDRALTETKAGAVMLVAPFGIRRGWDDELAICRAHGAAAIIDNASGLGVPRPRNECGPGVFEVFSMHATKPFAVGEGGVIFADRVHEGDLRSALSFALHSHGERHGPRWGFNGKMSELHAAVGIAQLRRIDGLVARRQAFVKIYHERLAQFPEIAFPQGIDRAPWQFCPVLLPSRLAAEAFINGAAAAGVEIRRYYRPSLSQWPETLRQGPCPVAEDLAERMCVLPVRALDPDPTAGHERLINLIIEALQRALIPH